VTTAGEHTPRKQIITAEKTTTEANLNTKKHIMSTTQEKLKRSTSQTNTVDE
jgi:hypothetical protein